MIDLEVAQNGPNLSSYAEIFLEGNDIVLVQIYQIQETEQKLTRVQIRSHQIFYQSNQSRGHRMRQAYPGCVDFKETTTASASPPPPPPNASSDPASPHFRRSLVPSPSSSHPPPHPHQFRLGGEGSSTRRSKRGEGSRGFRRGKG